MEFCMIKLIASDVDGTLLRGGARELEPRALGLIQRCLREGIVFVVSSGRQYPSLKRVFEPIWRHLIFVADNGAVIMRGDKVIHQLNLPDDLAHDLILDIKSRPGCEVLASTPFTSYVESQSQELAEIMLGALCSDITRTEDLSTVTDNFTKVSAFAQPEYTLPLLDHFTQTWSDRLLASMSGSRWIDFGLCGKGTAIRRLMDDMGIRKDEAMTFGDNFNDEEMFRAVGHPFAMATADPVLREMCGNTCDAVEDVLEKLLETGGNWE